MDLSPEPEISITRTNASCPFLKTQFDCVVVVSNNQREARTLVDQIKWYKKLPIFIRVGVFDNKDSTKQIISIEEAQDGWLVKTIH
jgi:hypothetical protein